MYAEIKINVVANMYEGVLDRLSISAKDWQLQISITKCSMMLIGTAPIQRIYTVSGKKEATLFSTTTLAFLGRFL